MSVEHYNYLLSLPLVLHIPTLHAHVVHAGLLPLDPTRSVKSQRQPLSHIPSFDHAHAETSLNHEIDELRTAQELAVVTDM